MDNRELRYLSVEDQAYLGTRLDFDSDSETLALFFILKMNLRISALQGL